LPVQLLWKRELSEQHPREQGLKLMVSEGIGRVFPLSEQHPREQGLKQKVGKIRGVHRALLSEQHPREQGLKRYLCYRADLHALPFQSNIQENKD